MNYPCVGLLCLFILCTPPPHPVDVDDANDDGDDDVNGDGDDGDMDDNDGGAVFIEMW